MFKNLSGLTLIVFILAVTVGAFHGGLWATLAIGLAIILYAGTAWHDHALPMPSPALGNWLFAWLILTALELPLSSHADISRHMWLNLASVFVPLTLLSTPRVQATALSSHWLSVTAGATFLGTVLLAAELYSGGYLLHHLKKPDASLTEYNRGMAHLVIFAFPVMAGLWGAGRRRAAILLILLLLIPAGLTESHTAKLALIVGLGCTAGAAFRPTWVRNGLALFLVTLIGFPFYIQKLFLAQYDAVERWHDSWRHRVEIWDYLSYRMAERPWFGWGLGTTHTLDFTKPHGALYQIATVAAPHAHNVIIEIWVETGIVGLLMAVGFMLYLLRRAFALPTALRPFTLGGWAAALTIALFGFDFWTDALWGAFALAAFAFGLLDQRIKSRDNALNA